MNNIYCTDIKQRTFRQLQGILAAMILLAAGCAPGNYSSGPPFKIDLLPPVIVRVKTIDEYRMEFTFDEDVEMALFTPEVEPPLNLSTVTSTGDTIVLIFSEAQSIGTSYILRMGAVDNAGNSLEFIYEFTGWNPNIPDVLINELNPRGSGNNPDCIELLTLCDGNLGGLRITVGTAGNYSGAMIFPAVEVSEGDYILVHPKSEGLPEEIDETERTDVSGGLLASVTARDFWMPGSPGLPGNNGAVTLYNRKGGDVIDAVLWSDRIWIPEDSKLGWTSDGYSFASELSESEGWLSTLNDGVPSPSEAVDVSVSTATRSLCRSYPAEDTNTASDWHTVPTSGKTFGEINNNNLYEP